MPGTQVQEDAQRSSEEVHAGTKDAEQVQDDVTDLANESIDPVEGADIPDEAKQQLEEAQKQLNEVNSN